MSEDANIAGHYHHGSLLQAIETALAKMGKSTAALTIDDLAPVDEFHVGGRIASEHLFGQLEFDRQAHLLDVGCGLGGAARFVASRYGNRVSGIDLAPEYIETGKVLCEWLGLLGKVSLQQGNATSMPFADDSFDGAYMLHVGMNIEDKEHLFRQVARVLRSGARFGVYDIMRIEAGDPAFPLPFASAAEQSWLATPEQYRQALRQAGFELSIENSRRDFALEFLRQLREKSEASGGLPPLGLHTLMQQSSAAKVSNLVGNIQAKLIAPVEMIACKI